MADSIAKSSSSEINDGKPAVKQKSEVRLEDSLPFLQNLRVSSNG